MRTVANSKIRYFAGACILAGGLLIKFGAPLAPVVAGMILAWVAAYRLDRRASSPR